HATSTRNPAVNERTVAPFCLALYKTLASIDGSFWSSDAATTAFYTLSLHDALPIWARSCRSRSRRSPRGSSSNAGRRSRACPSRSEEHTCELQSPYELVWRLPVGKTNAIHPRA